MIVFILLTASALMKTIMATAHNLIQVTVITSVWLHVLIWQRMLFIFCCGDALAQAISSTFYFVFA